MSGYRFAVSPIQIEKQNLEEYTCVACAITNALRLNKIRANMNRIDKLLRDKRGKSSEEIELEKIQYGVSFDYNFRRKIIYGRTRIIFKKSIFKFRQLRHKSSIAVIHAKKLKEVMYNKNYERDSMHAVFVWKIENNNVYIIDSSPWKVNGVIVISLKDFKRCITPYYIILK